MHIDDFILCLTKMGYKKGEVVLNQDGRFYLKFPQGIRSYITYQNSNAESEDDEWGIVVKTDDCWKHSGHSPLILFNTLNGHVDSYIYMDDQLDTQFLKPTGAEDIESIGDLCYLLQHKFRKAIDEFVRCNHAKN